MGISFEKIRKKLGVNMLVKEWQTKMYAAVTIQKNRKSHEVVLCEGNELVSTLKHPGKQYQCTISFICFESSKSYKFCMSMLSKQNLVDTIFGCVWHHGHTWAILGRCTHLIFIKEKKKSDGYIIWEHAKKLGVTMLVKEWQTKM